jgi:hypothetical protein
MREMPASPELVWPHVVNRHGAHFLKVLVKNAVQQRELEPMRVEPLDPFLVDDQLVEFKLGKFN